LRRIMQIHITEEARHLCFAREYLRTRVPRLGAWRRQVMAVGAPLILGAMAREMLEPPAIVADTYRIPRDVMRAAYREGALQKALLAAALEKVHALCAELDLLTSIARPLWRTQGLA
jgi:hypothetical protein